MPIIKSAKKKVAQDKKRTGSNKSYESALNQALDKIKKSKGGNVQALLKQAVSKIDKAAKKKVIHKKKASRLKSQLSKLFGTKKKPAK